MSDTRRPVVLIAEKLAPSVIEALGDQVEVRHVDGTDRVALLDAVAQADALLVRSATKVNDEVLAAAPRLKVIARAGVGLDNVEVPAATARGVMVVNAPTSNIVSAAEHAVALLLATARQIPFAHTTLQNSQWKRGSFNGVEISGKTIGIVGLGKIGQLFAARMAAFEVRLIAYDPYVSAAKAAGLGIELVSLDELLSRADAISIHLPKTPETKGIIGADELSKVKPGVIIINAARGGLVDEAALAEAIKDGRVGGAGIDVFEVEPTVDSPLFGLPNVVVTPHLGASTTEAQDRAGTDVAKSVLLALRGEFVPEAVNVQGAGVVSEEVAPYISLVHKLGIVVSALSTTPPTVVEVDVRGEIANADLAVLPLAALRGVFSGAAEEQVTFVNAPSLAASLGVSIQLKTDAKSQHYRSLVTLNATQPDGTVISVAGTLSGLNQVEKLVGINGCHFDLRAQGTVLIVEYHDQPGNMGLVGTLLGEAGINIEAAQIGQIPNESSAFMVLRIDQSVDQTTLDTIGQAVAARIVRIAQLS